MYHAYIRTVVTGDTTKACVEQEACMRSASSGITLFGVEILQQQQLCVYVQGRIVSSIGRKQGGGLRTLKKKEKKRGEKATRVYFGIT